MAATKKELADILTAMNGFVTAITYHLRYGRDFEDLARHLEEMGTQEFANRPLTKNTLTGWARLVREVIQAENEADPEARRKRFRLIRDDETP